MLPRIYKQEVDNRKQQINTLKIFNDNVTEIVEDSEYEISFQSGENRLVLLITLGKDFPKEKPMLVVSPAISHSWINEKGVITTAPGLINFTPHSDLGRVVQAIIREFQRNPPLLISEGNVAQVSSREYEEKRTSPSFTPSYSFSPLNSKTMQTYHCKVFPDLNKLSLEELRFMDKCEDRQVEFIEQLPNVKEQSRKLEELILQIEETAEDNLSKEQQLYQLREAVDCQIEEVTKLAFDNERLFSIYQNLSEKYSPRNIQQELGKAAKLAEEDSEKIAEAFLQGDLDIDKFLNMFIKSKALYQSRKTKEEKLCHQLDRLEKAGF